MLWERKDPALFDISRNQFLMAGLFPVFVTISGRPVDITVLSVKRGLMQCTRRVEFARSSDC